MTLTVHLKSRLRSTLKNAQNDQKSHQNASVDMQILHATLAQLLKITPKKRVKMAYKWNYKII